MDGFDSLIIWLKDKFSPVLTIPNASLFVFAAAFGLVMIVVTVYKLVTDVRKLQACELEIKKHASDLNEAKGKNDKAALRRLKREEIRLKQSRSYVLKQRLKVTLITIAPLMFIYLILGTVFLGEIVAVFPFEFPLFGRYASFSVWYMLCYLMIYFPLSRIFEISMG